MDDYFAAGMERLAENRTRVEPVSAQLLEVLADAAGKQAVAALVKQWAGLDKLQGRYRDYLGAGDGVTARRPTAWVALREGLHDAPIFTPAGLFTAT